MSAMPLLQIAVLACAVRPVGMGEHHVHIDAGHHVTVVDAETLQVESRWLSQDPPGYVALRWPLPATAHVQGAEFTRDPEGRVTGVYAAGDDVSVVVRMPAAEAQALGAVPLVIADAPGLHRVTFDPSLSFRPAPKLGFAPHLRRATTRGVSGQDSKQLDARLGDRVGAGVARYASHGDLAQAGGFVGILQTAQERRRRLLLWAGAAFALVVAALAAAHRSLRRGADVERADAMLAQEIDALGQ